MNYGKKLTPEIKAQILAFIRAGAWPHEACRAAGVPDKVSSRWMDPMHTRGPSFDFQIEVKKAQAIARIVASQIVKKEDPFKWLANGPARDAPGEPGWAAMSQPIEVIDKAAIDPLQFPEFVKFVNAVRIVMAHFPEARIMLDELLLTNPEHTGLLE